MPDDDFVESPTLRRAIDALREEPAVRPEWRATVLEAAAKQRFDDARPIRSETFWSLRPSVAIAAALCFMIAGAGATYMVMNTRSAANGSTIVATASAATEPRVRFALVAPSAVTVTLVGDFNGWDPRALPMRRSANGETWEVEVGLAPGRYTYAFVVDGHLARDPSAAEAAHDDFGAPSSVLLVKGS